MKLSSEEKSYHDRGPRRAGEPREALLWDGSGVRAAGCRMVTARDSHRARRATLRAGMATGINTSQNLVGSTSQRKSVPKWRWANSRARDKGKSGSALRRCGGGSSREQHGAALAALGLSGARPAVPNHSGGAGLCGELC